MLQRRRKPWRRRVAVRRASRKRLHFIDVEIDGAFYAREDDMDFPVSCNSHGGYKTSVGGQRLINGELAHGIRDLKIRSAGGDRTRDGHLGGGTRV